MHIKTKLISTAAFVMGAWLLAAPAYAIAGPQGAIGYLAQQDPAFRQIALANGWAVKKSQAAKDAKPAAEPAPVAATRQRITCPASHPNLRDVRGELRCYR